MTSRTCFLAIFLYLSSSVISLGQTNTPAAFRTKTQLVLVPISAIDKFGKTVTGLHREDFSVFDDSKPQQIVAFTSEDAPASMGLVFDSSGSMRNTLSFAKDLAHEFFRLANPEDEFFLLTVGTQPEAISGFTTDVKALENAVGYTHAEGMTALIDTVYLALTRMHEASEHRRAVLVISDGMDNNSRYTKGDLLQLALEADVQVYAVIVNGIASTSNTIPFHPGLASKPIDMARERQGPNILEELAEKSGGLHFHVSTASEAQNAVDNIAQAIRSEYVLAYQAPPSDSVGKWHRIRIKSHTSKVKVYARTGYYSQ